MSDSFYDVDPCKQIQDILSDFDELDEKTESAVKHAVEAAGDVIVQRQRALCPRKTGKLSGKIERGQAYKNKSGGITCRCGLDFKKNPDVKYGIYVEFGRRGGKNKDGKTISPMKSQPFIRPGADAAEEEAAQKMADVFFEEMGLKK